jgi:glycosidase
MRRLVFLLMLAAVTLSSAAAAQDDSGLPWWNTRIFYEIFVRSFGDSDGDGIGDLRGLTDRLDYLNTGDPDAVGDLGVTGLWLMPIMPATSYHGYDVTDYYAVNPEYGTADDFRALITAAHARGIAVIIDLVINHTSREHPWFISARGAGPRSPYYDYYVWADTPTGGGWHTHGDRYYYGYFGPHMPDLNYTNPDVTAAMYDIATFWLDDMGVDGFRLDAAKYIIESRGQIENTDETLAWLADFKAHVHAVRPDALVLGEVWSPSSVVARYIPDSLDLAFEFDLAEGFIAGARSGSAAALDVQMRRALRNYPPGQFAPFLTNHDQTRAASEFDGDMEQAKTAAALLLTASGVPFIYYGEEVGMEGTKPDPRIRTPMPWTGDAPGLGFTTGTPWQEPFAGYETANVAAQDGDPESLLNHYRALIDLRRSQPALSAGNTLQVEADARAVYSILRYTPDEALLVIVNLSAEPVTDYALTLESGPLTGTPAASLLWGTGDVSAPQVNATGGFDAYRPLAALAPHSSAIVRLGR